MAASGAAATSAVVWHELLYGARTAKVRDAVEQLLEAWEVLPVDRAVAGRAAAMRRDQASRGVTLSMADALIAATAELRGLAVVTGNVRDFPAVRASRPEEVAGGD